MERIRMIGGGSTVNSCPFPVGFGGFFKDDPNEIYSGTKWEQKKDVFILAAGDTYPVGSTGGEAEHTLTVEEMPKHRHSSDDFNHGYSTNNSEGDKFCLWLNAGQPNANEPLTGENGPIRTSWVGGSQPHNNMPPYYSMPFWVRTA